MLGTWHLPDPRLPDADIARGIWGGMAHLAAFQTLHPGSKQIAARIPIKASLTLHNVPTRFSAANVPVDSYPTL